MKKTLLIPILFLSLSAFCQVTKGLVAHWKFNGDAKDISGHGLNGIVSGATSDTGYSGRPNTAYKFNGISDHIDVAYDSLMNLDSFSICALFKAQGYYSGVCQGNFLLCRGTEFTGDFYSLQFDDNMSYSSCLIYSPSKDRFASEAHGIDPTVGAAWLKSDIVDSNTWYCFTATYDGDSMRVYVNG